MLVWQAVALLKETMIYNEFSKGYLLLPSYAADLFVDVQNHSVKIKANIAECDYEIQIQLTNVHQLLHT